MVVMLASCMTVKAQTEDMVSDNMYLGFAPFGGITQTFKCSPEKYKYKFKDCWNVVWDYDMRFDDGFSFLFGADFGKGKFESYDFEGTPFFNPTPDDLTFFSLNLLMGFHWSLDKNGRFDLGTYIGPGISYLRGGPLHHMTIDPVGKIRLHGYVTNTLGLFIGASYRYHFGFEGLFDKKKNEGYYSIKGPQWNAEVGITFSIGSSTVK